VTHSPQVAARGGQHWRIAKREAGSAKSRTTLTEVAPLAEKERREQIAPMLAGATVTDAARAAADSLLAGQEALGGSAPSQSRNSAPCRPNRSLRGRPEA